MVGRWGMSKSIGMVSILSREGVGDGASPETLDRFDDEVRGLVETAFEEVVTLLGDERERLEALADALLEHETLDQADAYEIAGLEHPVAVA
jgi:cell division protease FtsH